jgi:hypothetical protein
MYVEAELLIVYMDKQNTDYPEKTANIGYIRGRKTKQIHHHTQGNTNGVNNT